MSAKFWPQSESAALDDCCDIHGHNPKLRVRNDQVMNFAKLQKCIGVLQHLHVFGFVLHARLFESGKVLTSWRCS